MKKQLTILFLLAVLFFIQLTSFAQQQDSLIQLYPTLGDTISRRERDFYKLFPEFPGFEKATVYIRDNDSLLFRITYITPNGEGKDTTQIHSLKKLGNIRTYIHAVFELKKDSISKGKTVTVTTLSGNMITGNIAKIDDEEMVLFIPPEKPNQQSVNYGADFRTISKDQVKSVLIHGESKVLSSMGGGALIGAVTGAIIGVATGNDSGGILSYTAEEKALMAGASFALLGAATGLVIGLINSTDDESIGMKSGIDYDKLKYEFNDLTMVLNSHNEKSYTFNLK